MRRKGNKILRPQLASGCGVRLASADHRLALIHQYTVPPTLANELVMAATISAMHEGWVSSTAASIASLAP